MKKIIAPLLMLCVALGGMIGASLTLAPTMPNMKLHASSGVVTEDIGQHDSITVPLANLIINNFSHEYPEKYVCTIPGCIVMHFTGATLLKFVFDNGSHHEELYYSVTEKHKPINYYYWAYDAWYDNGDYGNILTFTDTSNGLVITQNTANTSHPFINVTIYTYAASMTVSAGSIVPTEFIATFIDIDGNILATIETVGRYVPDELVPTAPEINQRPFMRWTSIQGFVVNEIITANVTFIPLYGYDPNYEIKTPIGDDKEQPSNKFDIGKLFENSTLVIVVGVIVFLMFLFLINSLKGVFRV